MAFDDNLKRSGNTYILKSKTKTHKKGECEECGHNPNDEYSTGLYRYKASHMQMVRNAIEDHLKLHSNTESCTPEWCSKCKALKQYVFKMYDPKKLIKNKNKWNKHSK